MDWNNENSSLELYFSEIFNRDNGSIFSNYFEERN